MKITTRSHSAQVKTKAVKSKRIAWLLRKKGYKILSVQPNRQNPEYNVYIFEAVPGFSESLTRLIKETEAYREQKIT